MAKFFFKRARRIFVSGGGNPVILPDAVTGVPTLFTPQVKSFVVEGGSLKTEDPEILARIRKDPEFNTDEIKELSAADEKAMQIRSEYIKMAEAKIAELKNTP